MWKWVVGATATLVIVVVGLGFYLSDKVHLRFEHTEISPQELDRSFTPQQLRADFAAAIAVMQHIHPNFGAVVDRAEFERLRAEIAQGLDRPMTRLQFFAVVSRLNGAIHDGHSGIVSPSEEWHVVRNRLMVPPIGIRLEDNGVVIERAFGAHPIPSGAHLLSINGVTAEALEAWLIERQSGETLSIRRAFAADALPDFVWLTNMHTPFEIAYAAENGAIVRTSEAGAPFPQWRAEAGVRTENRLRFSVHNGVAVLYVGDFEQPSERVYTDFLNNAFDRIRSEHVTSLIIDVRQNQGGDSRQADTLQSYISDRRLPALDTVSTRTTREVKALYRTLLPEEFRWLPLAGVVPMLRGIEAAPVDGMFVSRPEAAQPQERWFKNPRSFSGEVYVLIGPRTYSTAALFVAPLQHWRRATIVGEPTEEGMTFFGDLYETDLPHTHIVVSSSHKIFALLGSRGVGRGIVPDIDAASAQGDAMQAALDEIGRREAARRR